MRRLSDLAAVIVVILANFRAHATSVVTFTATGTIQPYQGSYPGTTTIDTYGIFGPAGADLTGKTITVYEQYIPSVLGEPTQSGHDTQYQTTGVDFSGAVQTVVTVNGVQKVYIPVSSGYLDVFSNSPHFSLNISTYDAQNNGAGLVIHTKKPVIFGKSLLPARVNKSASVQQLYHYFANGNFETLFFELSADSN